MSAPAGARAGTPVEAAAGGPGVDDAARRKVAVLLAVVAAVTVAYWVLWFADRALLASETRAAYYEFENAFPLADGFLVVAMLGSAWTLWTRRPSALGWLLAAGGMGLYLFGMDVLYDLEQGIWWKGGGGGVELVINVATLVISAGILRWAWRRRTALSASHPPSVRRTAGRPARSSRRCRC
ncbi:MAG TPA: hypothetical protein VMU09_10690 [Acidimicrobiales bacterium]|nr:hypothetical protein [Acidimicrobiales bacterium]